MSERERKKIKKNVERFRERIKNSHDRGRYFNKWILQKIKLLMKNSAKKPQIAKNENYSTILFIVVIVTLATRFYKVAEPDHVW